MILMVILQYLPHHRPPSRVICENETAFTLACDLLDILYPYKKTEGYRRCTFSAVVPFSFVTGDLDTVWYSEDHRLHHPGPTCGGMPVAPCADEPRNPRRENQIQEYIVALKEWLV